PRRAPSWSWTAPPPPPRPPHRAGPPRGAVARQSPAAAVRQRYGPPDDPWDCHRYRLRWDNAINRFPTDFVERKDGQDYVAHHVVNQRLLSIVGPFDFELVEVIRGDVAEVAP